MQLQKLTITTTVPSSEYAEQSNCNSVISVLITKAPLIINLQGFTFISRIFGLSEFNSISINGEPPSDFEFNAILWYYTVHDHTTNLTHTNLFGIENFSHNSLHSSTVLSTCKSV